MKKITKHQFKLEVIDNDGLVLVEFYTEWSGSAFIITKLLSELEKHYENKVRFVLINIEETKTLSERYGVKKIPTILFFKDGEVIHQLEGIHSRNKIENVLDAILNGTKIHNTNN